MRLSDGALEILRQLERDCEPGAYDLPDPEPEDLEGVLCEVIADQTASFPAFCDDPNEPPF